MKAGEALRLYEGAPRSVRAFIKGRVKLSELETVERFVPGSGAILDLGCGHGVFTNLLALSSPGRQVTGLDPDPGRIAIARSTVGSRSNVDFAQGDIFNLEEGLAFDAIAIVDVLYLLPREEQARVLAECRRRLRPRGQLIWKAQERRPRWKFAWTYIQETIATSLCLTRGRQGRLSFLSRQEALQILRNAGFGDIRICETTSWRPYPDIIYLANHVETN